MPGLYENIYADNVSDALWEQKEAKYLEIYNFENEPEPVIRDGNFTVKDSGVDGQQGTNLHEEGKGSFEDFVAQTEYFAKPTSPKGNRLIGGLRIIAQSGSHDYLNGGKMKMSYANMKLMLDSMRMPCSYPLVRSWRVPIYLCLELFPSCSEDGDKYLVSTFISPRFRSNAPLMFLSYERETSITTMYLCIVNFNQWAGFEQIIRRSGEQAKHPMLVPMYYWHQMTGAFESANRRDLECLLSVKRGTGLSDRFDDAADPVSDLADAHQTLVTAHDGSTDADSNLLFMLIKYSKGCFECLDKYLTEEQKAVLRRDTQSLWELHRYLDGTAYAEQNCWTTLQQRIEMTQQVLYTMMQQKDTMLSQQLAIDSKKVAEASKRDSSSMKTIAALTMVFLPGTAVATIFSMSAFFSTDARGNIVTSHDFKLYWYVVVPLTIFVVGVWVLWMYFANKLHKEELHQIEVEGGMHKKVVPDKAASIATSKQPADASSVESGSNADGDGPDLKKRRFAGMHKLTTGIEKVFGKS